MTVDNGASSAEDRATAGEIVIGQMSSPLRNGSRTLVMKWEATRRPVKVCEGGGWYSAHPTATAWVFRSWLAHKSTPSWAWPKVADERDVNLNDLIERAFDNALLRYGFTTAQAIEARRAATLGAVHESAVGTADAPDTSPLPTIGGPYAF